MTTHDDDFGEIASPTLIEMWRHQAVLMTNETEYLNQELVKARQNIAKLVAINEALQNQLSVSSAPKASRPQV
ncbi:hypothetical protein [Pseudomonas sp. UM16]|uniref:hypothetical protein n=1 Tax=Pseudomonas sp. UM16 TaxID=3158962 RepID=UPI00398FE412